MLVKKTDIVREAVSAGQWKKALSIAKGFRLGLTKGQQNAIIRAYECMVHPEFYVSIGVDLQGTISAGKAVLSELYG